ncbi:MAG: hypothetical protein U5K56_15025 [Halioglobus sp.]|nr:hypothetical protein [Halioglobus sp.]
MGDVLEFPSQRAQGLVFLERELRGLLRAKGADEPLIEFAADRLTQIYCRVSESEQYGFSVRLPDGLSDVQRDALEEEINNGLRLIHKENHSLLLELVAQLVLAEVRLFQHQRPE